MTAFAAVFTVALVVAVAWGVGRDWCQHITDRHDRVSDEHDRHRNYMKEISRHADEQTRWRP